MGRGGHKQSRAEGPERTCLATGETRPQSALIRFVAAPDGSVVPDIVGKLPGRGFYVIPDRDALQKAVKKNLFARGARASVRVPETLIDEIDKQLPRRLVELISLARRAGAAVAGYEKVKSWLDQERAHVLIQANDGSERGKSKLSTPHRGVFIGCLSADELGMAFGRQTVIHAALASGGLTARVVEEAARLRELRRVNGASGAGKE